MTGKQRRAAAALLGLPYPSPKGWYQKVVDTLKMWDGSGESPFTSISIEESKKLAKKLRAERRGIKPRQHREGYQKKEEKPKIVQPVPAILHGWDGTYSKYLDSKRWARKRKVIMALHGGKCWITGKKAQNVHHITYARIYREAICDLMPLCQDIHEEIHRQKQPDTMAKTIAVLGEERVRAFVARYRDVTWEQASQYSLVQPLAD